MKKLLLTSAVALAAMAGFSSAAEILTGQPYRLKHVDSQLYMNLETEGYGDQTSSTCGIISQDPSIVYFDQAEAVAGGYVIRIGIPSGKVFAYKGQWATDISSTDTSIYWLAEEEDGIVYFARPDITNSNDKYMGPNQGEVTENSAIWSNHDKSIKTSTKWQLEAVAGSLATVTIVTKNGDAVIGSTTVQAEVGSTFTPASYGFATCDTSAFTVGNDGATVTYTINSGDNIYIANGLTPSKFVKAADSGLTIEDGCADAAFSFRKIVNDDNGSFVLFSDALNKFVKPSNSAAQIGLSENIADSGIYYSGKQDNGFDWISINSDASDMTCWVDDHTNHAAVAVWYKNDAGAYFLMLSEEDAPGFAAHQYEMSTVTDYFAAVKTFNATYSKLVGSDSDVDSQILPYREVVDAMTLGSVDGLASYTSSIHEMVTAMEAILQSVTAAKLDGFRSANSGNFVRLWNVGRQKWMSATESASATTTENVDDNIWQLIPTTENGNNYNLYHLKTNRYLGFNTTFDQSHPTVEAIADATGYEVTWIVGDNFGFTNNTVTDGNNSLHVNTTGVVCRWSATIGIDASYWNVTSVDEIALEAEPTVRVDESEGRVLTFSFAQAVVRAGFEHLKITLTPKEDENLPAPNGLDETTGIYTVEDTDITVTGNTIEINIPESVRDGGYTVNVPAAYFKGAESDGLSAAISNVDVTVSSTTGIHSVVAPESADAAIYDLQGRRVLSPSRGLYIVNGKKIMMK